MPQFAANLSMMFTERPFLERFAAANRRDAGEDHDGVRADGISKSDLRFVLGAACDDTCSPRNS